MNRIVKISAYAVVSFFILAGCSTMPVRPEKIEREVYAQVKEYISLLAGYEMQKNDVTELSIALVDDQRVDWAEGFGFANKAGDVPATPETIYLVGSISKLFTATAAMQLAEQGKLDTDKPLQTYLPAFSIGNRFPGAGPITPRTIMTTPLLLPMGMTHSSFQPSTDSSPLGSKAYRKGEEAEETPLRDVPAGGLNSTVLDLSRFMEMVFAGGRAGERQDRDRGPYWSIPPGKQMEMKSSFDFHYMYYPHYIKYRMGNTLN